MFPVLCQKPLGLVDEVFVVAEGDHPVRVVQQAPLVLADFLLLPPDGVVPARIAEKVDHLLFDVRLGEILDALPEAVPQVDVQPRLLLDLPQRGLVLVFPRFHMPLGEGPVPAVAVLDEQEFHLILFFAVDKRPAGFFANHPFFHSSLLRRRIRA